MRRIPVAGAVLALKGGAAVMQFLILVLTARWFGVAFRGDIALFNATVNLLVLVVGFTGSVSLSYVAARRANRPYLHRLLAASYAFAIVVPLVAVLGSALVGRPLDRLAPQLLAVSVTQALLLVHTCVLLSGRAVWQSIFLEFLRPFLIVAMASGVAATRGFHSNDEFYTVWVGASLLAFLLSVPLVVQHVRALPADDPQGPASMRQVVRQLLQLGFVAQASNLVQFLNYRSMFFALERHAGLVSVGLFSTAVSLAEVLWIPANSLAALTLNRVARGGRDGETRPFVLRMSRLAILVTIAVCLVAALVPSGWITALLGRDFAHVKLYMVSLLPGVIAMGWTVIASAYHAGHGLYARNLLATLVGLALTAVGYFLLVPRFGEGGALVAMNASYLATGLTLLLALARRERVRPGELVPRVADLAWPRGAER